ncbi:MAG: GFA family protein [Gammaproteobacteria bacterium]|nr:GFA family protein [Gammaproteobacteria bacterium]MBI5618250.1 GFA family protein [Gammaproteobacteria bacterium]
MWHEDGGRYQARVLLELPLPRCQRASGSAFCAMLETPRAGLTVDGDATYCDVVAESGRRVSRGFCPTCGSPLFIPTDCVAELQGRWARVSTSPHAPPGRYVSPAPAAV